MNRVRETDKNTIENILVIVAGVFVVIAITMPFIIRWWYKRYDDYSGLASLGTIGDFIGGSTIAFFNLASIVLLVATMWIQRKELRSTQEEYHITNVTMKKQQFENTFFNMISLQNEITRSLTLKELRGKDVLNELYMELIKELKSTFQKNSAPIGGQKLQQDRIDQALIENYQEFFDKHENILGHYMRNLYRIVKFISESEDLTTIEKRNYFGILRAQWTTNEFLLIYFNIVSKEGVKFKGFAQKYDVLDIHANNMGEPIALKENIPVDKEYRGLYILTSNHC